MAAINYRKLKAQIKPFKQEAKHSGYIFIATDEQKRNGIDSITKPGSKRSFIKVMKCFINDFEEYREEFSL